MLNAGIPVDFHLEAGKKRRNKRICQPTGSCGRSVVLKTVALVQHKSYREGRRALKKGSFKEVVIRASIKNLINPEMPNIRCTHQAV
jgi:hypothetical protein